MASWGLGPLGFFSDLSIHSLPVLASVVVLTSILFSLGGFINAVFANTFDDISIVPTFVLTPLIYLGHWAVEKYLAELRDEHNQGERFESDEDPQIPRGPKRV